LELSQHSLNDKATGLQTGFINSSRRVYSSLLFTICTTAAW